MGNQYSIASPGEGTASLKIGTHCQTTAPVFHASALEFSLTATYFWDLQTTVL